MIAGTRWANNDKSHVIHRFHKRESCLFHSIHRFSVSFVAIGNNPLTCDNAIMERVFAHASLGQPTLDDGRTRRAEVFIDTRRDARIYSSGFAPKPGRT